MDALMGGATASGDCGGVGGALVADWWQVVASEGGSGGLKLL